MQKLCLLQTAFQAVETKEAEILLINVSETVNNFFYHDSMEAYIKILFLGRLFGLVCLLIRFRFQIAKNIPPTFISAIHMMGLKL